jgi:uncharacterized membrane protein YkoI
MKRNNWLFFCFVILLVFGMTISTGCTKKEGEGEAEKLEVEEPKAVTPETELPAAVVEAINAIVPDAEIDFVEVVEENGVTLYDIEFKDKRGEIEMTEDGTIIDVVTVITMEDLPEAAAQAIQKATEGVTILRLEKSEIYSEINTEGEKGTVIKLDTHRFVYEAELEKDGRTGEITVDADGNTIESLKWDKDELSRGF